MLARTLASIYSPYKFIPTKELPDIHSELHIYICSALAGDYQSALKALSIGPGIRLQAITPPWTEAAFSAGFHLPMAAEQSHNSINKCKDDMRTRGQADSGMGQHIASNALKCAQEKLRCDCTKGGKSRGRRLGTRPACPSE